VHAIRLNLISLILGNKKQHFRFVSLLEGTPQEEFGTVPNKISE
jgi:hypothetical protein